MLMVEIVSDIVCPWCWIGTRRLATAVELVRKDNPGFELQPRWKPFFLNPDTPPEGEPYLPFLEKKFGGRDKVDEIFARVRAAGAAYGLNYAFEDIPLRANTLKAHRLLHRVQSVVPDTAKISALVERLFQANFQRAEYVGDIGVLARIAGECGYDAADMAAYLSSEADAQFVRDEEAAIRAKGIGMVPTFVLPNGAVIVGAEDPAILAAGIRQAIA